MIKSTFFLPKVKPSLLFSTSNFCRPKPIFSSPLTKCQMGSQTLLEFMSINQGTVKIGDDLAILVTHLQCACKRIAAVVASPFGSEIGTNIEAGSVKESGRDAPKPLDLVSAWFLGKHGVISAAARLGCWGSMESPFYEVLQRSKENDIILSSLRNSGKVAAMASEEDEEPVWINDYGPFVVVTDPLDGSRNIDASIPTGTIFGIYNRLAELDHLLVQEKAQLNSLQSGNRLLAAGYVLYSSATILCISFGSGTHAFTLDRSTGEFVLTHPSIQIPRRGQIYSVNDARYFDWPDGLRRYIDTVRQGKGQFPKKYSARYICSLVADLHRTLMYGGVVMNPRDHLRLVYEANPLSFLVENAGGRGSDGKTRILSIQPVKLHQRLPLFMGSLEDMCELESYDTIQQKVNPGYEV